MAWRAETRNSYLVCLIPREKPQPSSGLEGHRGDGLRGVETNILNGADTVLDAVQNSMAQCLQGIDLRITIEST